MEPIINSWYFDYYCHLEMLEYNNAIYNFSQEELTNLQRLINEGHFELAQQLQDGLIKEKKQCSQKLKTSSPNGLERIKKRTTKRKS